MDKVNEKSKCDIKTEPSTPLEETHKKQTNTKLYQTMGSLWGHVVSERLGPFHFCWVSLNGMMGFMGGPRVVSVFLFSLMKC